MAAQANGILYWPRRWQVCLAAFKTFWAVCKYKGRQTPLCRTPLSHCLCHQSYTHNCSQNSNQQHGSLRGNNKDLHRGIDPVHLTSLTSKVLNTENYKYYSNNNFHLCFRMCAALLGFHIILPPANANLSNMSKTFELIPVQCFGDSNSDCCRFLVIICSIWCLISKYCTFVLNI